MNKKRASLYKAITCLYKKELKKKWKVGDKIPYSGPVYDQEELIAIMDSLFDGWFGVGKSALAFENQLSEFVGMVGGVMTNSGSSANLLALEALKSEKIDNHLNDGDEVIIPALTFPTTLNPILQLNLIPVFIDVDFSLNIRTDYLDDAIWNRTKAIFLPHTLGNVANITEIMQIKKCNNLFLIEDTCDALGTTYKGKRVGSFGEVSTCSFYCAHHITTMEGGMVLYNEKSFGPILRSLRDWGRACSCQICSIAVNPNSLCQKRFKEQFQNLPGDYDSKYVYETIGYNLKPVELQAAMGLVQLKRIHAFIEKRKSNFKRLLHFFLEYRDWFYIIEWLKEADISWFAYPVILKEGAPFSRKDLVEYLELKNIETRLIFAGNILRHPAYRNIKCRVIRDLFVSNYILENAFFLGVYPGITEEMMTFMLDSLDKFLKQW